MKNVVCNRYRQFALMATCISVLMALPILGRTAEKEKLMTNTNQYERISARLAAVTNSLETDVLKVVGKELERLAEEEDVRSGTTKEHRKNVLRTWLEGLAVIDRLLDPNFDPENVPQINVMPPLGTGLSSGASPDAIRDPTLRREYKRAIELNAQKSEHYHGQKALRDLDEKWSLKVQSYVQRNFTQKKDDIEEIQSLIDTCVTTKSRKKQLKKALIGQDNR